ncbi:hypothetical protein [Novosphingobium sp.]|uniref:hypothetical protein n=1 Tax=Novosphingobium sp. TaxID=1874826 RepID=UPI0028A7A69E|nr:hypothetical protein [Novosphingobium sp.]
MLIGAAANLMSPFSGEGANLAMYDSVDAARWSAQNLENFFGDLRRKAWRNSLALIDGQPLRRLNAFSFDKRMLVC